MAGVCPDPVPLKGASCLTSGNELPRLAGIFRLLELEGLGWTASDLYCS